MVEEVVVCRERCGVRDGSADTIKRRSPLIGCSNSYISGCGCYRLTPSTCKTHTAFSTTLHPLPKNLFFLLACFIIMLSCYWKRRWEKEMHHPHSQHHCQPPKHMLDHFISSSSSSSSPFSFSWISFLISYHHYYYYYR